jgi:hypothetical protein
MRNSWEDFHGINQDKFVNNLTEFLEDWIKFSEEEKNKYFEKFLKKEEEKECKVTFLSRVLKYPENTLLPTLYFGNKKKFQEKIKRIRELYFQINPRLQKNTELNKQRIEYLINQTSSYILNRAFISDQLNYHYRAILSLICPPKKICSSLEEKVLKKREDLQNDFLKLLEEAPKEAFKSHEYLFYYLLLKEFSHFELFDNKTYESIEKKSDFLKKCKNIYKKKTEISNTYNFFFQGRIFSFFKEKFKDFHDNNDYKSKLQILEEKKKNYPDFCDNKDCNNLVVNNDELNNSNDSWFEGVMNISPINSPDNSNNGNKRKLEEECSNEITQNNYKKRLLDRYSKQNPENSDTSDSQKMKEQKSYTNFSINSILGVEAPNNTKLNYSNISIRHLLGIKKPENQNLLNRQ